MTTKQVAQLVVMLAAAFPSANVTEATSRVYEQMLKDLDFEVAQRACAKLICSARFMPTVAEIREQCGLVKRELANEAAVVERRKLLPSPYAPKALALIAEVLRLPAAPTEQAPMPRTQAELKELDDTVPHKRWTAEELDQAMEGR